MKTRAIYAGTFDPVTNGHIDIINRAATLFPEIIVAVANSEAKKPRFKLDERIHFIQEAIKDLQGVSVMGFDNLLIDFAKQQKASILLRGLRANDFEYEFQLAGMNRKLNPAIETVFLTPSDQVMFISSTLVKEIVSLGGDVSQFVPLSVMNALHSESKAR